MLPNELLSVRRGDDGVLLLEATGNGTLDILGTTVRTSFNQKPEGYSRKAPNAAFFPEQGVDGLIMVKVDYTEGLGKHMYQKSRTFMLTFRWNGETPEIVLNKEWIPRPDRIGQLQYDSFHAIVDGVLVQAVDRLPHNPDPEVVYIADANLLCKYLAGQVSAEVIKDAPVRENPSKTYQQQAEEAQTAAATARRELDVATSDAERYRTALEVEAAQLAAMTEMARTWRDHARGLAAAVRKQQWFIRPSIAALIEVIRKANVSLVRDLAD